MKYRFSIIIPTFQRKDDVISNIQILQNQDFRGTFEVICVVDGSTDGTLEALEALNVPFSLTVIYQDNQGAAAARNKGARIAKGEILLFLDDDMEADSKMLFEHDQSYKNGADMVVGHMPIHSESPKNLVTAHLENLYSERKERLSCIQKNLNFIEVYSGQLSIKSDLFRAVSGFDEDFTKNGYYGLEDTDLGYRLFKLQKINFYFNPQAISYQKYSISSTEYLKRKYKTGQRNILFNKKHLEVDLILQKEYSRNKSLNKILIFLISFILRFPLTIKYLSLSLSRLFNVCYSRFSEGSITKITFRLTSFIKFWEGVADTGEIPTSNKLRILAYHSISDVINDPIIGKYTVQTELFKSQIKTLKANGFRFITLNEFEAFLDQKRKLPKKSILLTFDDGYSDFLTNAYPLLQEMNISSILFIVTDKIGKTNNWDSNIGSISLDLLKKSDLIFLLQNGNEIGSHSRNHPDLLQLSEDSCKREINGSFVDLSQTIKIPPKCFSYPYGYRNDSIKEKVMESGFKFAFNTNGGKVKNTSDPYDLNRILITNNDVGKKFLIKIK